MAYGPRLEEPRRKAAGYVDKILKGARPADLPVEQPEKFDLVINLKTAKALRLTIPPSILLRADQVIERWTAASSRPVWCCSPRRSPAEAQPANVARIGH